MHREVKKFAQGAEVTAAEPRVESRQFESQSLPPLFGLEIKNGIFLSKLAPSSPFAASLLRTLVD